MNNTKKTICNMALLKLGLRPVKSFNDNTREAKLSGAIYDFLKTELIESYDWTFTIKNESGETIAKESDFPPVFTAAFTSLLTAEFALSILDDERKYNLHKHAFNKQLTKAKFLDSNRYKKQDKNFPLIAVRK